MASGTDGNIISYDTSGNPVAVATGSAGQVLTSAGAGAVPTFADAGGGGGGLIHIKTQIITSDVASVDFIHGTGGVVFDGTYKRYKVIYEGLRINGSVKIGVQFRVGSSFVTADYEWSSSGAEEGSVFSGGSGADSRIALTPRNAPAGTENNVVGEFILSNPADTARYKALSGYSGGFDGNNKPVNYMTGGVAKTTSAANGFRFIAYTGDIKKLTVSLFGVAGS